MPIYQGETQKTLLKGDYRPAEFYKGSKKITGYDVQGVSGEEISIENTYNDTLAPTVQGNGAQDGTPTPDSPVSPAFSEGKLWSEGRNLFAPENILDAYISGQTIVKGPNTITIYAPCDPSTVYTVSKKGGERFQVGCTNEFPTYGLTVYNNVSDYTSSIITIETNSDSKYIVAYVYNRNIDSISQEEMLSTCQIEKGSAASFYQPYRPPISIELPVLRAIPDGNGGFSAKDILTPVDEMPGW